MAVETGQSEVADELEGVILVQMMDVISITESTPIDPLSPEWGKPVPRPLVTQRVTDFTPRMTCTGSDPLTKRTTGVDG
jgi:hypothetical protein